MFLLVCFSNRNISFSLIVQRKNKVRFEDVDNAKKSNKAQPASKQSGMQIVLKASNNLYWFSSIFSFWRQQQLMFYVFLKYLLNHHRSKISLVINLKVHHLRMMIKVQKTTIKHQRMTTKHQRMMAASEMMESKVNIFFYQSSSNFCISIFG